MEQFTKYVRTLKIAPEEKEKLLDKSLFEQHWLYIHLVPLLTEPEETSALQKDPVLESISLASYLYFRALLSFDTLMDGEVSSAEKKLALFTFFNFLERSVRTLATLFEENDPFWAHFETCKQRYISINIVEKELSKRKAPFSQKEFEWIAAEKSAVCDAIVYALDSLKVLPAATQDEKLECLKFLHIAFQYQDDIDDFKKDIAEGQWTYARSLVDSALKEDPSISNDYKHRYLYVSGIAQSLLEKAQANFSKAAELAVKHGLHTLAGFIERQKEKSSTQINEITLLIEKTMIKAQRSNVIASAQPFPTEHNLAKITGSALNFIQSNLDQDGYWKDFLTHAGFGREWVTAYTALLLTEAGYNLPELETLATELQHSSGAYNESMLQDADSLNFIVGFLKLKTHKVPQPVLDQWLQFRHANGGWSTYNDEKKLKEILKLDDQISTDGWTMPHNCVSATAGMILTLFDDYKKEFQETAGYLVSHIEEAGYIRPYWWTSPVYSTAFALMALNGSEQHTAICKKMAGWMISEQAEDGCWHNKPLQVPSAFYTAIAMKALLTVDAESYSQNISKAAEWLLHNQATDGSWLTNHILLLPATDVTDIRSVKHWRKSSFGVNVLVDDHNRIFTTVTALNALKLYEKLKSTEGTHAA